MESEKIKIKIKEGIVEFQSNTMFMANYLRCNLYTRSLISSVINERGEIDGMGLKVFIDSNIPNNQIQIGMGQGPTYSITNL